MKSRCQLTMYIIAILIAGLFLATAAHAENPDFGGSCNTAKVVAVPSDTYGRIGWKGDKDYFKLTVGSAGVLTVYTTGNKIDTEGFLYNSSCGQTAYNDDGGNRYNFKIEHPVSAGTYYVQVRGWRNKSRFNYQFSVEFDGQQNHTITASAGTGGSISPSGAVTVGNNGNMTFSITPNSCYESSDVTVDGDSKGVRTSWTFSDVTSDHTIHADFTQSGPFVVDASAQSGGTITPSGTINANCGDSQSFVIDPESFYEIFDVLVDGVSVGAVSSYTISNIGQNHTIEAKFKEFDKHTIETITGDGGSISPIGPVQVYDGTSKTFSIAPFNGFKIEEVWVNGTSMGIINSYTFENITADQRIEARFAVDSSGGSGSGCLDISDTPLDVRFQSAPPNIMFVLDDSGSMDWELMTPESNGIFEGRYYYVFDDPGDHVYYPNNDYYTLKGEERKKWKTQFWGYNRLFYNSEVTYEPWPGQSDADIVSPRSHPMNATHTLTLADPYLTLTRGTVIVDDSDATGFEVKAGVWNFYGYWGSAYNENNHQSEKSLDVKRVKYSPNLDLGSYNVYARWATEPDSATKVKYKIFANGVDKDEAVIVDQQINAYQWNLLGTYTFTPDGYVRLVVNEDIAEDATGSADAMMFEPTDNITISNAHYYTFHDTDKDGEFDTGEQVYLVNFVDDMGNDGVLDTRKWYEVNDDGDDILQQNEFSPIAESSVAAVAPELVARSITDDLQNFANWYSFYRRRELSATAAVASVIDMANRMQIGISSINGLIKEPVHKINVNGVDERDILLTKLYNMTLTAQGTPLRRGLQDVGKYFDKTDSGDTGGIGTAPWYDSTNGGACQQAFAIVMTDGYYNGGEPWSPEKDHDGNNGAPYADNWSNTLADVAMYYYENDLVSDDDLKDLVPTTERDSANHQHLVTYGVGFGVTGTLNPDDYDEDFKHISTSSRSLTSSEASPAERKSPRPFALACQRSSIFCKFPASGSGHDTKVPVEICLKSSS